MTGCSGGGGTGGGGGGRDPQPTVLKNPLLSILSVEQDKTSQTVTVTVGISTTPDAVDISGYQFALSYNANLLDRPFISNADESVFGVMCGVDSKNSGQVRVMGVNKEQNGAVRVEGNSSRELAQVTFETLKKGKATFQLKKPSAFPAIVSIYKDEVPASLAGLTLGESKSVTIK